MGHKWDWGGQPDHFPKKSAAPREIVKDEMYIEDNNSV
jgi:hypothetical protein